MLQGIIVVIILCAALFFVLRRLWQTSRRLSKGECGCTGCASCQGPGTTDREVHTEDPL